jgi:hypothetical protein
MNIKNQICLHHLQIYAIFSSNLPFWWSFKSFPIKSKKSEQMRWHVLQKWYWMKDEEKMTLRPFYISYDWVLTSPNLHWKQQKYLT